MCWERATQKDNSSLHMAMGKYVANSYVPAMFALSCAESKRPTNNLSQLPQLTAPGPVPGSLSLAQNDKSIVAARACKVVRQAITDASHVRFAIGWCGFGSCGRWSVSRWHTMLYSSLDRIAVTAAWRFARRVAAPFTRIGCMAACRRGGNDLEIKSKSG